MLPPYKRVSPKWYFLVLKFFSKNSKFSEILFSDLRLKWKNIYKKFTKKVWKILWFFCNFIQWFTSKMKIFFSKKLGKIWKIWIFFYDFIHWFMSKMKKNLQKKMKNFEKILGFFLWFFCNFIQWFTSKMKIFFSKNLEKFGKKSEFFWFYSVIYVKNENIFFKKSWKFSYL